MTTTAAPTVAKPRAFFGMDIPKATFQGHAIEAQADGSAIVRDYPIFKAGTFRDSWGDQHTWTSDHLKQMVDNFDLLLMRNIFPDVPVRADHSLSVDKVKGYFESVRTDGVLLYADLRITEPEALDKLARGTYRSRSLEVGMFVANDESAYWPTIFGVAFVDIPAVEGLHSKPNNKTSYFSLAGTEENPMSGQATPAAGTPAGAAAPDDLAPAKPAVQQHATPAAPAPVAVAPAPAQAFRVHGVEITDVAAVQRHIDTLEAFAKDTRETGRKDFVASLAKDGKVLATQVAELQEFALGLPDAMYDKWVKTFAAAATNPLLAKHGNAQSGEPTGNDTINARQDRINILQDTIAMHRRSGMSDEKIAQTNAAKELAALTNTAKS